MYYSLYFVLFFIPFNFCHSKFISESHFIYLGVLTRFSLYLFLPFAWWQAQKKDAASIVNAKASFIKDNPRIIPTYL